MVRETEMVREKKMMIERERKGGDGERDEG